MLLRTLTMAEYKLKWARPRPLTPATINMAAQNKLEVRDSCRTTGHSRLRHSGYLDHRQSGTFPSQHKHTWKSSVDLTGRGTGTWKMSTPRDLAVATPKKRDSGVAGTVLRRTNDANRALVKTPCCPNSGRAV